MYSWLCTAGYVQLAMYSWQTLAFLFYCTLVTNIVFMPYSVKVLRVESLANLANRS